MADVKSEDEKRTEDGKWPTWKCREKKWDMILADLKLTDH